jgi:DNA-binding PadR family transcriptional regulator
MDDDIHKRSNHMHHHHWDPFDMSGRDRRGRGRARGERGHGPGEHGHRGHGPGAFDPRGFPGALGFFNLFRRGPRARRGDIRHAILVLLAEQSRNGYQIMQELEQRSRGMWRPSPGAVYPALQQLEDERLVTVDASGSGRVYSLTERGRKEAAEHAGGNEAPWDAVSDAAGSDVPEMFHLFKQLGAAALQVAQAGSTAQVAEARRILSEARKALYRVLAEDDGGDDGADATKE